jgi:hypothetical protein
VRKFNRRTDRSDEVNRTRGLKESWKSAKKGKGRKTTITLQENFNYVTGKLQLHYRKTSITLQENFNYVTGKLQLRYRKTTITLQENLNHSHERQLRTLDGIFGDCNWKINKIRAEDIFKAM